MYCIQNNQVLSHIYIYIYLMKCIHSFGNKNAQKYFYVLTSYDQIHIPLGTYLNYFF